MSEDLDPAAVDERASFKTLVVRERKLEPVVISEQDIVPGTVLGSYRVVSEIGAGAVGRVYLGEHALLGRKVALKTLRPEYSNTPSLIRRFFAEAKLVNEIGHPNIVAITDFVISDRHPIFYVMELLEGCTLHALLKEQSAVDVRTTIDVAMQLCAALHAAHEKSVVHRDLKPENVFLLPHEARYDVRLLDFGVAKFIRSHNFSHTGVGALNGTPRYMSPEATLGSDVDQRTDLYSLGMLLYEMLAGFHPFEGLDLEEMLLAQRNREVEPLEKAASQAIPVELAAVVRACLEKNPDRRPSSAAEIRERLARIIVRPPPRRGRMMALSATIAVALAAVAALTLGGTADPIHAVPEVIVETEPSMPIEPPPPPPASLPIPAVALEPAETSAEPRPKPKVTRRKKVKKRRTNPSLPSRKAKVELPDGSEVRNPYD
jgi:serine/threonine protein kinase